MTGLAGDKRENDNRHLYREDCLAIENFYTINTLFRSGIVGEITDLK